MSVAEFRARIRFEFEQNRNVQDLNARNILILKWTMELIETHNKWKQRLHLMRLFDTGEWAAIKQRARNPRFLPASTPGVSTFLAEFLAPRTGL